MFEMVPMKFCSFRFDSIVFDEMFDVHEFRFMIPLTCFIILYVIFIYRKMKEK